MNLYQVAEEISRRLASIFLQGRGRPAAGLRRDAGSSRTIRTGAIACCSTSTSTATTGPASGASHQTGWTGIIARTMHLFATMTAERVREGGGAAYFEKQKEPAPLPPKQRPAKTHK